MSIYATLWTLKFPRYGDDHGGCEWVDVLAQGVPEHVGRPTGGSGCEAGDPFGSFLPSTGWEEASETESRFRAVVFVTPGTPKGTDGHPQEYLDPLLVLSGIDYRTTPFPELHAQLCDALRGDRPRIIGQVHAGEHTRLLFDDRSHLDVAVGQPESRDATERAGGATRPWWRLW